MPFSPPEISDWGRMFGLPPAFALLGTMARPLYKVFKYLGVTDIADHQPKKSALRNGEFPGLSCKSATNAITDTRMDIIVSFGYLLFIVKLRMANAIRSGFSWILFDGQECVCYNDTLIN